MGDDTPIDKQRYLMGLNVVDIGDVRVSRGKSRRPPRTCNHNKMTVDTAERRIWCEDCESEVQPFDAFMRLAEGYNSALDGLKQRKRAIEDAETHAVRSRAAKAMDDIFRKRTMVPACPNCRHPLMPEQVIRGLPSMSKSLAERLLRKKTDS